MYPTPLPASLLPKLRDHYAEFLDPVSLVHLRLLALPTCVGLRYGHLQHSLAKLFLPVDSTRLESWVAPSSSYSGLGQFALTYILERPIHKAARISFLGPLGVVNTLQAGPEF